MIPKEDWFLFNPNGFAALVIDMHRGHLDEDATIPLPRGRRILATVENFMERLRKINVPIIHVISKFRKGGIDKRCPQFRRSSLLEKMPRYFEHNIEGTKYVESLVTIKENDCVVDTKKRYSSFHGTDLELLLRNLGVDTLVITGIAAEFCVLNTCFDALSRDFKVIVPEDCVE
ncbi:MAG: hypothetical protein A2156_01355, partial [Deltaproteobacteria bacterium RBG_16_48_10]